MAALASMVQLCWYWHCLRTFTAERVHSLDWYGQFVSPEPVLLLNPRMALWMYRYSPGSHFSLNNVIDDVRH